MPDITCFCHGDLDGITSAAIFTDYMCRNVKLDIEYHLVNYDEQNWKQRNLPENSAVLDFMYNPSARFFLDHHSTGLAEGEEISDFTRHAIYDEHALSATGLLFEYLKSQKKAFWDWAPWAELIKWIDIVDSAGYESAQQVVESKEPVLQLRMALSAGGKDRDKVPMQILEHMIQWRGDVGQVVKYHEKKIEARRKKVQKAIDSYPKMIKQQKDVGMLNLVQTYIPKDKYVSFFLYPNLQYQLILTEYGGDYALSVSKNPWGDTEDTPVHLGRLCEKYGGGGHADAAKTSSRDSGEMINTAMLLFTQLVRRKK
jgi:hypothetical protein